MNTDTYRSEIVDPGDRASQLGRDVCFGSHKNSHLVHIVPHAPGNFRGPVGFLWAREIAEALANFTVVNGVVTRWEMMQEVENDGAGGKPQFFTLLGEPEVFRGLGWEIIAMTADDFARTGRLPVVIDNEVNVRRVTDKNFPLFQAMMEGYGDALRQSGLVNITGETAIMKRSITAFCDTGEDNQLVLTWGASCIGLCDRDRLIDGTRIRPGMPIVGLHEKGYRCNGGGFFADLITEMWGSDPRVLVENSDVRKFVRKLVVPSISYARLIARLIGWESTDFCGMQAPTIHGIAHITGGGVWGKFAEILPPGVGALLDRMPVLPAVLLEAQEMSRAFPKLALSDAAAYGTFHGGCGMLIICEPGSEGVIIDQAIRAGIDASEVGETFISDEREVLINSRFLKGGVLSSLSR